MVGRKKVSDLEKWTDKEQRKPKALSPFSLWVKLGLSSPILSLWDG